MDPELKDALRGIKDDIKTGHAYLSGQLASHAKQMQDHLLSDSTEFTTLKLKTEALKEKLEAAEKRRNEESERRTRAVQAAQVAKDQWKIARYMAIGGIIAVLLGVLATSVMNSIKLSVIHEEQKTQKIIP